MNKGLGGVDAEAPGPQIGGQRGPAEPRLSKRALTKAREEERFLGLAGATEGGKPRGLCPRTESRVLVSHWSTTMCGPLSHPATSEHHASLNGKTDALLLIATKTW